MSFPIDHVQTFIDRFCNRYDVYAVQKVSGSGYWYEPVHEPVTTDLLDAHLTGTITLGFYVLSVENKCKWLCMDFDYEGEDMQRLLTLFRKHGWHCLPEGKRLGRDGHLWLFFDEPVPALQLRRFAFEFVRKAGISLNKLEVFPKQNQLKNVTSLGNLVRGPLGVHRKPSANMQRGWFGDAAEDVLTQLEFLAAQQLNRAIDLLNLMQQLDARELIAKVAARKHATAPSKRKMSQSSKSPERINWIGYARTNRFSYSYGYWSGPCPSCKSVGHDSDSDHLHVSDDGIIGCFRGCSFEHILNAVKAVG